MVLDPRIMSLHFIQDAKGNLSPTPTLNLTKAVRGMTMWRTASRKWQLGSGQLRGFEQKEKRLLEGGY